jgi:hypothetical protein
MSLFDSMGQWPLLLLLLLSLLHCVPTAVIVQELQPGSSSSSSWHTGALLQTGQQAHIRPGLNRFFLPSREATTTVTLISGSSSGGSIGGSSGGGTGQFEVASLTQTAAAAATGRVDGSSGQQWVQQAITQQQKQQMSSPQQQQQQQQGLSQAPGVQQQRLPSQVTDDYWIHCELPDRGTSAEGKWMLVGGASACAQHKPVLPV